MSYLPFGAGFNVTSGDAIDSRIVLSLQQMQDLDETAEQSMPSVYICVCSDNHDMYVFDKNNDKLATTGKFRQLSDYQSVVQYNKEQTLTEEQKAQARTNINAAAINGLYEDMTVGLAENLIDTNAVGTARQFTFDTACGDASISDEGTAEIDVIKGKTLVFNQIAVVSSDTHTVRGITITKNQDGSVTLNGTADSTGTLQSHNDITAINGHKYLLIMSQNAFGAALKIYSTIDGNKNYTSDVIAVASSSGSKTVSMRVESGAVFNNFKVYLMVFDLTQMFGVGNEPATVDDFKKFFPLDYYEYNTGELLHYNGTGIKTVGFNQWDEQWERKGLLDNGTTYDDTNRIASKNYIRVLENTEYYIKAPTGIGENKICFYDGFYNFISKSTTYSAGSRTFTTPLNCQYIKFAIGSSSTPVQSYNNDICVNFSWGGYRNGEYEPYWTQTKSLPISTYFTDGMKSAGTAYDELYKNKAVHRVAHVNLGSLNWLTTGVYTYAAIENKKPNCEMSQMGNIKIVGYDTVIYTQRKQDGTNGKQCGERPPTSDPGLFLINPDFAGKTIAEIKQMLEGTVAYYELATPTETTIDPPLNLTYKVADFGTEESLPENDEEPVTTPFTGIIKYNNNFTKEVVNLPKNYTSSGSLDNLLSTLGEIMDGTFTKTFNNTTGKYDFTFTPNT